MRGSFSDTVAPITSNRMAVSLAAMLCPVQVTPRGWLVKPCVRTSYK